MQINELSARIRSHEQQLKEAILRVIDGGWLVLGPEVKSFENAFAAYLGVQHCVGVANGTDALEIALRAAGVCSGDKVATVANAGMYCTTAALSIGAEPVFMDVDAASRNATLAEVQRILSEGVKAVVITHLYGQPVAETREIAAACSHMGVPLIEDCAQAHGASLSGRRVGSFGTLACFSFYPTKNLGALGDGGAVTTSDASLAQRVRLLRQYGWTDKYKVEFAGARNSRLDELQAAVLSTFLPHLDRANARRREIATQYGARITNPAIEVSSWGEGSVVHLYVIRVAAGRESLREHLKTAGIGSDVHYPIPDHRQPAFKDRFSAVHLPNTEELARHVLTLPCYPEMTSDDVDKVVTALNAWHPPAAGEA